MAIYESGENYLETIFILQEKNGTVRSIDVANELGYTKASVSRAMSILKKAEYIKIAESGNILLTESGRQKATQIFNRHKIITEFLMNTLQVDEALADKDACRIEHIISEEVFEKMKKYVENGETL
ncbi:MAG: metal-dependent transcriptional regulator [Oscillospiraceae bacterium]|nr:metal-dependent transcriptional regulator [Oscillospiraceae bacterium]